MNRYRNIPDAVKAQLEQSRTRAARTQSQAPEPPAQDDPPEKDQEPEQCSHKLADPSLILRPAPRKASNFAQHIIKAQRA